MRSFLYKASVVLMASATYSSALYANTAANTTITNKVVVNYADAAANTYDAEAVASFVVTLVAAQPNVEVDPMTQVVSENVQATINYTFTATANGPDNYVFETPIVITPNTGDLSAAVTPAYSAAAGVDFNAGTQALTLGASTLAAALNNGATSFTIPWDGSALSNDAEVNKLKKDDLIWLDGAVYTIDHIDSTGADAYNNIVTVYLDGAYAGATLPVGTVVGEVATVSLTFTAGTLSNNSASEDYNLEPEIAYNSGADTFNTAAHTVTVARPMLAISKYVRNVTTSAAGSDSIAITTPDGNASFYQSGVAAKPGDVMEYLLVVDNTVSAGAEKANNIIITDRLPMYTSVVANSVYLVKATDNDISAVVVGDWSQVSSLVVNSGAEAEHDETTSPTTTLCFYPGTGGNNQGGAAPAGSPCQGQGGSLGPDNSAVPSIPAQSSFIIFRLTVN